MNISHNSPNRSDRKKQHRALKVDAGFSFSVNGVDHLFQTDQLARFNATGRASKITAKRSLSQEVPDFQWRSSHNIMVDFTGIEFLEFAIAMDEFVESQYQDSWS
jgi:hypothetical protein